MARSRARFAARLLGRAPTSVLDVGCGGGHLLHACRAAGVRAVGLESSPEHVLALVGQGLEARSGSADALPFPERSFGWVALRHVLHHLPHPARAVAEACRVAADGVVLAEPWTSRSSPPRDTAALLDAWTKQQDRRLGRLHAPDHSLAEMTAFLTGEAAEWELETECFEVPELRPAHEVRESLEACLAGLAPTAGERGECARLLELAARTGAAYIGTAILVARRRR